MYKFENKIKEAEKNGIMFSEGQKTYIRCAKMNGIDLLDHLFDRYSREYLSHPHDEKSSDFIVTTGLLLSIMDFFDENLCELVDEISRQNKL